MQSDVFILDCYGKCLYDVSGKVSTDDPIHPILDTELYVHR
jgi:hypothetical protein